MSADDVASQFQIGSRKKFRLKNHDPRECGLSELNALKTCVDKAQVKEILDRSLKELAAAQELLYADDRYSLLMVLQGMDASGKDGTIKHVMSGVNPQGCQVFSFKKPSPEEYDHTFLWRFMQRLPERGRIGIFNRSYYEDVVVARVHPEVLGPMPEVKINEKFWQRRYEDINAFERHLVRNGTIILKFFLNMSKGEQRRQLLQRLDQPEKNWKFNPGDLAERELWGRYMDCYESAIRATDTNWAPWHVIPADHKPLTRVVVARIIVEALAKLKLAFPKSTPEQAKAIKQARLELGGK